MIIGSKFSGYSRDNRRLYHMDGGGGSSAPAKQTQIADLPEWSKPYAKETLGKAQALTDISQNPYQTYGGEKVAGFTPLQQQSFQGAGELQPSQLGAQAGQMAGAATMGALGTHYDPYRMGQFTSGRAAQYMNPFVEQAMEPQLREAQRASEIQRQSDLAGATRAGAFGGSRQAIVEAERQRNLGTQLGDIRAKGYMTAFDQAQQNFAREQQLREQSRQYGAGLGLQGLQTALQGAGQLGQLGGQQFGQAKDVIGLQSQLGGQQQQLEQQRLSQSYQDFMNQQRYPYQQLEFMSNILRGTPMGTVQTMYGGQPNTMGQLAGLGAGLYGAFGKAKGGMVDSYAEGGVTSDQNVETILSKLSDAQLQQARQIAMAQRDAERVQMIDAELAERASLKGGLGGAFNMLPQDQQNTVTEMAGGGIVAFAGDEQYNDPLFGQLVSAEFGGAPADARSVSPFANFSSAFSDLAALGKAARGGKSIEEYYGEERNKSYLPVTPAANQDIAAETSKLARLAASRTPAAPTKATAPKGPIKDITSAAKAVATAAEKTTGTDRTSMEDAFKEGLSLMKDTQGEADSKRMVDLINKLSKSDAPDKMDMLANFGFKMAAAASKPGATFLSAASEGAQVVPEMQAQAKKEAKEAQRLGVTLEMEKLKLDAANRKGDRTAALQHAQNIRILEGQEAQIGETRRHNIATERNQAAQIAATKERYAAAQGRMGETMARIRAANAQKAMAQAVKEWADPLRGRELKQQYKSVQDYQAALFKDLQLQSLPQLELLGAVGTGTE